MDAVLRTCLPRRVRLFLQTYVLRKPTSSTVFVFIFVLYFLLTSGIIYDLVNQPKSEGTTRDRLTGAEKPQIILPYRLNGQYIKEGFAAGLLFSIGGLSFIILDKGHDILSGKMVRYLLLFSGLTMLGISYFGILLIMNTKLPQYLIYT